MAIEVTVPFGESASLKVTGATAPEVLAQLAAVENSEIPLTLGRVIKATGTQEALGRVLGAELVEETPKPQVEEPKSIAPETDAVPEWASVVPGAPTVNGKPAWLTTITLHGIPTQVFVHPSENVDSSLPKTDKADDPRLERGEAVFFAPIR